MTKPRPSAWPLIVIGAIVLTVLGGSGVAVAGQPALEVPTVADPQEVCGTRNADGSFTAGELPTKWQDEFHPPNTIRVLRSKGPNAGRVVTVNFWDYVGVVLRAEYSTGQDKPPLWMQVGAITVKQYGWYKTMFWGGGRVTFTNPDGVTTTTQCWDVKDTTADQIYKPEKWDSVTGTWVAGNVATPANLKAMRETWHLTMRKWMQDKSKSRLFLSGYRSGKQYPCGTDATGFKIYQKSLRDCYVKNLTLEETLRRYFEPNLQLVDVREHDLLDDGNSWRGDLGVINANGVWRVYKGAGDGFTAGPNGTFGNLGTLLGQGRGDVTGAAAAGANDDKLFADLIMLVNNGGKKLLVARSTGNGFEAPVETAAPASAEMLVVGDFNGDLLTDAGFLSSAGSDVTLSVMRRQAGGGWDTAVAWWTGALDLSADAVFVAAGDVNGDGKADLVMRDGADSDAYRVAASSASCTNFSNWGLCLESQGNGLGAATPALTTAAWSRADAKHTISDFDRDGRDDVLVVTPNGNGFKVMALRARTDGTFADPAQLWQTTPIAFADVTPLGMNVDPDGLGDLAILQKDGANGSKVFWLRSVEKGAVPASMVPTASLSDGGQPWSAARPF